MSTPYGASYLFGTLSIQDLESPTHDMHVRDELGCTLPVSFNIACWQMRHCLAVRFLPVAEKTTYTASPSGQAESSFYLSFILCNPSARDCWVGLG